MSHFIMWALQTKFIFRKLDMWDPHKRFSGDLDRRRKLNLQLKWEADDQLSTQAIVWRPIGLHSLWMNLYWRFLFHQSCHDHWKSICFHIPCRPIMTKSNPVKPTPETPSPASSHGGDSPALWKRNEQSGSFLPFKG